MCLCVTFLIYMYKDLFWLISYKGKKLLYMIDKIDIRIIYIVYIYLERFKFYFAEGFLF